MKKTFIKIKRGLKYAKHRAKMGNAIYLFLHILDRADYDTGKVFGWIDKAEAEELGMSIHTLRHDRRLLEEGGYISCKQGQHSQEITISNWTNPRLQWVQGDTGIQPSSQGDNQGCIQGDNQDDTQGMSKVITLPYSSEDREQMPDWVPPHFRMMTPNQAHNNPLIKIYISVTGDKPTPTRCEIIAEELAKIPGVTAEYLKPFWKEWNKRGFNPDNLAWISDWAVSGKITNKRKAGPDERAAELARLGG